MANPDVIQPPAPLPARDVRAFASNVGALGALQVVMRLQGLVVLPIISRTFGPAGYGLWTQFFVAAELVSTIASLSLDEPLVRFVAGSRRKADQREHFYSIAAVMVGANAAAAALLFFLPALLAQMLFGGPEYAPYIQLMALFLVLQALDTLALSTMRALQYIKLYALLEASQAVARVAVTALALLFLDQVLMAIVVYISVQALWLLIELALVLRLVGLARPTFRHIRESIAYVLPLIPTRYSNIVLAYSDRLIIAHFYDPAALGLYAAAYDFARLLTHVILPFRMTLTPIVSRLWDDGQRLEASAYLSKTLKYSMLAGVPAAVGLSLLAPAVLSLLSTPEFAALSRIIVPLVTLGILSSGAAGIFGAVLRLHKHTRAIALALITSAAIHLLFNFLLIPTLGTVGGAAATLLGYAVELVLMFFIAWPRLRFPLPLRPTAVALAAAALMAPVVMWIGQPGGWIAVLAATAAGAAVYGAAAFLMGAVTWREVMVVLGRSQV